MKRAHLLPLLCLLVACNDEAAEAPVAPAAPPPAAEAVETADDVPTQAAEELAPKTTDHAKQPGVVAEPAAVPGAPKAKRPHAPKKTPPTPRAKPPAAARTPEPSTPAPEPTKAKPSAPAPEPPKKATRIPKTKNVRVSVTPALQKLLDGDSRMQPWVNKVMQVADQCYLQARAKDAAAAGAIKVQITMHESARPSPKIQDLPPALSGVVACASGALFQTRMPLFTGPEGQRHNVSIHFGS